MIFFEKQRKWDLKCDSKEDTQPPFLSKVWEPDLKHCLTFLFESRSWNNKKRSISQSEGEHKAIKGQKYNLGVISKILLFPGAAIYGFVSLFQLKTLCLILN